MVELGLIREDSRYVRLAEVFYNHVQRVLDNVPNAMLVGFIHRLSAAIAAMRGE